MWILECDGLAPAGRRIWLRPGKTYLFGRTKSSNHAVNAGLILDEKSVSRKHLTVAVSPVTPGDGSNIESRSHLSIQDENTRFGTEVDGEQITGKMKDLQGDEHVFRMGHYKQPFRIKWHPVVLSFVFPSKDTKGGKDPLIPIRSRLEDLDIKTVIPFIPDKTTHVVASKRNTAKGLQALINAKFVVGNDFLDALEYATKPENLDELESFSPLEENFDQFWPKEQEYLPPPSKEPGQHSSKAFSPDQARKNIFRGYTFVFFDLTQFESLQPPITDGGGKTLFFPIEKGVTTAIEIVGRIKEAADEKAVGDSRDGGEGKCPVHVQFPGGKGFENWAATVQTEASVIIGQRLIGQNEFLEAILTNDASRLRQRIPIEDVMDTSGSPTGSGEPRPPLPTQSARNTPQAAESATRIRQESSEPSPPQSRPAQTTSMPTTRRVRPRGTIVSAFKGFDDGFEPTQVPQQKKFTQVNSQTSNNRSGLSQVTEDEEMRTEIYSEAEDQPVSTRAFKKRPLPSDDEDDDNESLLPAAAAMKKLRVEEENDARRRGVSVEPTFGSKTIRTTPPPKPKPKRQKKEVDIQEAVRTRREVADEAAQRDEESLRQTLDDMSVEEMKALAVVEEIEVAEREPLAQRANAQTDRWDERWNGRKNFKKFRRQGDSGPAPRRGQTVIVPLEEVRKNGQSIVPQPANSHESLRDKRKRKAAGGRQETPPPRLEETSPDQTFTSAHSNQEAEVPSELLINETEGSEIIDVDAPRTTRARDRASQAAGGAGGRKRPPSKTAAGTEKEKGHAPKKQKLFEVRDESDSEEEMKFRFRKRG